MREVFNDFHAAWVFSTGREGAAVRVCNDGWEMTWTGEKAAPEPPSAFERIVSRNGGEDKVDAPAEIVQRLKVRSVGMECDDSFYVCVCFPGQEHGSVFIPISQADTSRFKVGSIIEVVLRPAPLS